MSTEQLFKDLFSHDFSVWRFKLSIRLRRSLPPTCTCDPYNFKGCEVHGRVIDSEVVEEALKRLDDLTTSEGE